MQDPVTLETSSADRAVVVKIGGAALEESSIRRTVAQRLARLHRAGERVAAARSIGS